MTGSDLAQRVQILIEQALASETASGGGIEVRTSDAARLIALLHRERRASTRAGAMRLRIAQSPWPDRSDVVVWLPASSSVASGDSTGKSLAQLAQELDL